MFNGCRNVFCPSHDWKNLKGPPEPPASAVTTAAPIAVGVDVGSAVPTQTSSISPRLPEVVPVVLGELLNSATGMHFTADFGGDVLTATFPEIGAADPARPSSAATATTAGHSLGLRPLEALAQVAGEEGGKKEYRSSCALTRAWASLT